MMKGVMMKAQGGPTDTGSQKIVPGHGNLHADVMFIGEAPGREEDERGLPFVGPAGDELNETYVEKGLGLKRADVYVTNCVRVRPVSKTFPAKDRRPTAVELERWLPDLRRDIALVRPSVIVVLGTVAAKHLLATKVGVTKLRGAFYEYDGIRVIPTFHPAYVRRDRSKRREVLADMVKVRAFLGGP
jgi:uracil-DNA glycosylase